VHNAAASGRSYCELPSRERLATACPLSQSLGDYPYSLILKGAWMISESTDKITVVVDSMPKPTSVENGGGGDLRFFG
jgi:hypothetical protein